VFVHTPGDQKMVERNRRLFGMHKNGDMIVYIPEYPNRREASDAWYLALDIYLTRGLHSEAHPRGMKVRVITPNKELFKFPFANEIVQDEISQRSMIETHFGWSLTDIQVVEKPNATMRYAIFKNVDSGEEMRMPFGSIILTPNSKPRGMYENSGLTDENGLVTVNPYTLQHTKYPNIFAFGDCTDLKTTKCLYASLNQGAVVRNNLWDYMHGNEFKAIYDGYSSFVVHHSIDRVWAFKHYYNYVPTTWNFYIPRLLSVVAYKLKNILEGIYLSKIYQKKLNFGYPYLQKNKYFRPVEENRFLKLNNISRSEIFVHENATGHNVMSHH
jgi:hypothetical protein